ncbi:MAG TPA: hypothetical protein VGF59_23555, partial [Bryobacteraceae bacterium]
PDTLGYRARKFARRQRNSLIAAGLAGVCLVAGLAVSIREASVANTNLLEARRLANAFVFGVHDAVRDLPGSTRARQLIVETGLRFLDRLAGNSRRDWALKTEVATAYLRIGDVQGNVMGANLGNTKGALESYQKALSLLDAVLAHAPGDRTASLERITVLQRLGTLYTYTQDSGRALASLRDAQKLGEELLSRSGNDPAAGAALADVYTASGDALWIAGAFAPSIEEHAKAVALVERFGGGASMEPGFKKTLAAAYSAIGMDEARLGHLDKGLEYYRRALPLLEELTRQDAANASYQRLRMSTYSHLGDVLGNPKWRSLGDAEGALNAYRQMLAAARRLYEIDPANQQAASDLAIALTRAAAVLPGKEASQRLDMLRESMQLLSQIDQVNPQNNMNRWDMSHGYILLGDALITADQAAAVQVYEQSVALGEALLAGGMDSPAPDLVGVHQRMALIAARAGDRQVALAHARRALEIADPAAPSAKARSESVQRFLTPRGAGAMGLVYAAFARAKDSGAGPALEDRQLAREWLGKSLEAWRALESDPAFGPSLRDEMRQVEAAAAGVRQ